MDLIHQLLSFLKDPREVIQNGGYPILMLIIFAETGLLIGFFLPGDSLLVTAGVLVNANLINPVGLEPFVNLLLMTVTLAAMAILGDAVGFAFGKKTGPALFKRPKSLLFRPDYLNATQRFYDKHGGKTIILARFMPFARTFAPIVAGIGKMKYARFAAFNVTGGIAWVTSMLFLGFFLGKVLGAKDIERVVYLIIAISVLPLFIGWIKNRLTKKPAVAVDENAAP
jgi:membrane-associated protein